MRTVLVVEGEPKIAQVARDYLERAGSVAVAVRDTGDGIEAEVLPRLFERFAKGPGSRGGSGFGLGDRAGPRPRARRRDRRHERGSREGNEIRFTLPLEEDQRSPSAGSVVGLHARQPGSPPSSGPS